MVIGQWQYQFANQRALKNTTEYNYKQIDVTGKCAEHAKANYTLKLVEFKFLVPKTFWSWVARTTSMLNAQKLTPSTGFAVSLIDVAVVIADRLGGWRWRRCRGRSRRGGAIQVDGGEGWHVGPLHWHQFEEGFPKSILSSLMLSQAEIPSGCWPNYVIDQTKPISLKESLLTNFRFKLGLWPWLWPCWPSCTL